MRDDEATRAAGGSAQDVELQQTLDDLARLLADAGVAVTALRRLLGTNAGGGLAPAGAADETALAGAVEDGDQLSAFDRLLERVDREKKERQAEAAPKPAAERKGLDLLPRQYLATVEDREGRVDLVPLHRAILGLSGIEDVSLVSYTNGVPVISLRVVGELDMEQLSTAIAMAMDRECELIPQENDKIYVRLKAA